MASSLTNSNRKWEYEFDWHLTNRCQFNCIYCHPQIKKVLNHIKFQEPSAENVCERFNEIGTCAISMSGGEPFLYPNFINLCKGLVQKHYIAINTNLLSDSIFEFADSIPSDRVIRIVAATHILERERMSLPLDDFVEKLNYLRKRNFNVTGIYILYPPLLDRVEKDLDYLRTRTGNNIQAKVFKGVYQGKVYPAAYTDAEREIIEKVSGGYQFNKEYLTSPLSFKGQLCSAGVYSFKVMVNGDVHRCATINNDNLGNLYEGTFSRYSKASPCTANKILVLSQCKAFLEETSYED